MSSVSGTPAMQHWLAMLLQLHWRFQMILWRCVEPPVIPVSVKRGLT